ncbi:hypothetical protein N657DRAFT_649399, partial [Parathielavia appendiculata]
VLPVETTQLTPCFSRFLGRPRCLYVFGGVIGCNAGVELSGFLGTKIHGLSTDVQCETLSQHRSITMTQSLT